MSLRKMLRNIRKRANYRIVDMPNETVVKKTPPMTNAGTVKIEVRDGRKA